MAVTSQSILGERLRVLRRARGASLAAVADATDMSVSFLSLLESGKTDVTIGRLMRLVRYYGVPVTDLLPEEETGRTVVRAAEYLESDQRNGATVMTVLPPEARGLGAELMVLQPGTELPASVGREGEAFLHLLEGELEITFDEDSPLSLAGGDSVFFQAAEPRTYRNHSQRAVRAVIVQVPAR